MEDSKIEIDQKTSNDKTIKKYTDFFPTLNLSYKLNEKESFTLGYSRRLRRPRSRFINPFPSRSSVTNIFQGNPIIGDLTTGFVVASLVAAVIFGGIKRIAKVASRMVPIMVVLYIIAAVLILANNIEHVPGIIMLIINDAFTGNAVAGGAVGSVIIIGVRRGMFSNEAGTGTETMAHGAAKTKEPIREGLVAMLGPLIDTIIVCSITAIVILISGVYHEDLNGVSMTAAAFKQELGFPGQVFLSIAVLTFALSTMFGYSYYGQKCASYLFGTRWKNTYNIIYIIMIVIASVASIDIAVNFVDSAYALMVIPTMISTFLLAPRVMKEAKKYFSNL